MQNDKNQRLVGRMGRREFLACGILGAVAVGGGGAALWLLPKGHGSAVGPGSKQTDKFVCTGDSWTSGNQDHTGVTYPALLSKAMPWATVTNDGHAGWTSTEVAARWGAPFKLGAFTTPSDGDSQTPVTIVAPTAAYRTETKVKFAWIGELRLPDGTTVAGTLRHAASSAVWSEGWTFQRAAAGSEVRIPDGSQFVCTEMNAFRTSGLVISVGQNDSSDPAIVVRDVKSILASRTVDAPFVVLALPTTVSQGIGTEAHSRVKRVNSALREEFSDQFVDIRTFLIDRGLFITATPPDNADLDAIAADTIPNSLLIGTGDHPNAAGYRAIATSVLDGLTRIGALASAPLRLPQVVTTAASVVVWNANDISTDLGKPITTVTDRTGRSSLSAARESSAPALYFDAASSRRFLSFDGRDDRMYGRVTDGNAVQPFTIIAKVRFRDLEAAPQGVAWTYDRPGATFSVKTSGRIALDAGAPVETDAGVVVSGATTTIVAVVNGSESATGLASQSLVHGDAGPRGFLTQLQVGYYFDTVDRYASIDLFELRFYPWALSGEQIAAIASQIG